jgi:hypothetical protein
VGAELTLNNLCCIHSTKLVFTTSLHQHQCITNMAAGGPPHDVFTLSVVRSRTSDTAPRGHANASTAKVKIQKRWVG